jgi:hypothetical protein
MNFQALADGEKRLPLPLLCALAVADVHRGYLVVADRQSGANGRIHASTQENNGARFLQGRHSKRSLIDDFRLLIANRIPSILVFNQQSAINNHQSLPKLPSPPDPR